MSDVLSQAKCSCVLWLIFVCIQLSLWKTSGEKKNTIFIEQGRLTLTNVLHMISSWSVVASKFTLMIPKNLLYIWSYPWQQDERYLLYIWSYPWQQDVRYLLYIWSYPWEQDVRYLLYIWSYPWQQDFRYIFVCGWQNLYAPIITTRGTLLVVQLVEALRYMSEGRWFDSRWCHWNFSLT